MTAVREGGCQCGAVRYRVEGEPMAIGVCFCTECQRQSGSAFGMSLIVREEAFRLLRGDLKTFTRTADSGRPVTAHFCPECGVRIFSRIAMGGGALSVKPGTLDDTSWLRPTVQTWTVRRQPWVGLPHEVPAFDRQR